ncbi:MAG: Hsp20/alpha crystallin family protein [Candidatus Hydrogenedentota bacterium]
MAPNQGWDPFRELDHLRREVERMFQDFGVNLPAGGNRGPAFLPGQAARGMYPLLNVADDENNLYVEALAPGVDPQAFDVAVQDNALRISGEKQALSEDIQPDAYHRNERSAGRFTRTIELPVEVNTENMEAQYKDGILLITLPKSESAKPRQIKVKVS